MKTVHLDRKQATTPGALPRVCMVCGKPATREVWCTYTSSFIHTDEAAPGDAGYQPSLLEKSGFPTDPAGCSFLLMYLFVYPFIWFASLLTATRFRGLSPRCERHARGASRLHLREVTPDRVVIEGVHDAFVEAVKGRPTYGP